MCIYIYIHMYVYIYIIAVIIAIRSIVVSNCYIRSNNSCCISKPHEEIDPANTRGSHLSSTTTCLTYAFFKRGESCCKL